LNVPVAILGLLAVWRLVPETRADERPPIDVVGIGVAVLGLIALTFGPIQAGDHGWGSASALVPLAAGAAHLLRFLAWERRPPAPLVDPALFRSASYTWGVILQAVAVLSMIGVLFTMPQYFQGVLGTDAMGSGIRLLPLIGGLVATALPAERIARAAGAKLTVAAGFALLATGLLLGTQTGVQSSEGDIALWMTLVGAGMGLALAPASWAALSERSEQQSGIGSAVMQALNKLGAPFGAAVLGSALTAAYVAHLQLGAVPPQAADAARQ